MSAERGKSEAPQWQRAYALGYIECQRCYGSGYFIAGACFRCNGGGLDPTYGVTAAGKIVSRTRLPLTLRASRKKVKA
jgi:DnaJ-class molecular chaperone